MPNFSEIFYGAAIQGAEDRSQRAPINRQIIETIKSYGFNVVSEHTTGTDFDDTAKKLTEAIGPLPPIGSDRTTFIRNRMIQFIESDIAAAVFEVSIPSLGTGIEVAHAYLRPRMGLRQIPVIALYQTGFWPNHLSAMIRGITKDSVPQFHLLEYSSPEEISGLMHPLLPGANKPEQNSEQRMKGRVVARKCPCCGHHEVGFENKEGEYVALKPGINIKITGD